MVRPWFWRVVLWAMASMPRARPLTIVMPFLASSIVISSVACLP